MKQIFNFSDYDVTCSNDLIIKIPNEIKIGMKIMLERVNNVDRYVVRRKDSERNYIVANYVKYYIDAILKKHTAKSLEEKNKIEEMYKYTCVYLNDCLEYKDDIKLFLNRYSIQTIFINNNVDV